MIIIPDIQIILEAKTIYWSLLKFYEKCHVQNMNPHTRLKTVYSK